MIFTCTQYGKKIIEQTCAYYLERYKLKVTHEQVVESAIRRFKLKNIGELFYIPAFGLYKVKINDKQAEEKYAALNTGPKIGDLILKNKAPKHTIDMSDAKRIYLLRQIILNRDMINNMGEQSRRDGKGNIDNEQEQK